MRNWNGGRILLSVAKSMLGEIGRPSAKQCMVHGSFGLEASSNLL
jgi:hypothetical protein